jgi:ribose transport system permease protein
MTGETPDSNGAPTGGLPSGEGPVATTPPQPPVAPEQPGLVELPDSAPDSADLGAVAEAKPPSRALIWIEKYALLVGFIAVLLFFSFWSKTSGAFGTAESYQALFSHTQVYIVVLSLALLFPLLCGEFDLSVGSVAGFSQIAAAVAMSKHGWSLVPCFILATGIGAIIGAINGNTVARVGVNSLIVTLGTAGILLGVVNWYTKGASYGDKIHNSVYSLGTLNTVFGIPRIDILVGIIVIVVWYVINHTPFGRYLMSVGSNPQAARLVGLRVANMKFFAFVISGALSGLAGMILFVNTGSGNPQAGSVLDTLTALAAVFLGATAIKPGRFNVEGTIIAIFFLAATVTGLVIAGVSPDVNQVFNGAALFVAVVISTEVRNRRLGHGH